ncbi:IS481 family transposase [Streptomyces sp. SID5474]|nr:IS481 family transposase [Streptomyces sp. SID5474]
MSVIEIPESPAADDEDWTVEHRFRAVAEVLDGAPVAEVARRYGTSRQSVHTWLRRFREGGRDGLKDRSRRPHSSPSRVPVEVELAVCQLRETYPRWGARRIAHALAVRGVANAPGRSAVHRILVRNGLVNHQLQVHRRVYKRWQRDAPMQLWQMDLMGGVFLADGRECKLVTGIDDHSRFIVIATVLLQPTGRAVCEAFIDAMRHFGMPSEVLTDNGKQFTGRFSKPLPNEVMFERVCRENGVNQRLTKPRSPTTTGKIERFHKTLRREMLDHSGPFANPAAAQAAIDAWVHAYIHTRPHQSLEMATPAQVFRPHTLTTGPSTPPTPSPAAVAQPAAEPSEPMRLPVLPPPRSSEENHPVRAVERDGPSGASEPTAPSPSPATSSAPASHTPARPSPSSSRRPASGPRPRGRDLHPPTQGPARDPLHRLALTVNHHARHRQPVPGSRRALSGPSWTPGPSWATRSVGRPRADAAPVAGSVARAAGPARRDVSRARCAVRGGR